MREYSVHPYHPEHAGAHYHHDGRDYCPAYPAGGGYGAVHEGGDGVAPAHYVEPLHSGVYYLRVVREQRQEPPPEQHEQSAEYRASREGVGKAHGVALHHSGVVPGAAVAAYKAGAGGVYRRLDVEYYRVRVGCRRVSGNRYRVEVVHAGLYEQVRHCENRVLYTRRNSQHEHVGARLTADVLPGGSERAAVPAAHEVYHYQPRRKVLRDNARRRDSGSRHSAADDEEKVQRNIERSGYREVYQRALGLAAGAEYSAAEVVHRHRRHSQGVYPQVGHCLGYKLGFRPEEGQHRLRQEQAHQADYNPDYPAHQQRGVHRHSDALVVACAQSVRRPDVNARAHSDEESGEERHQQGSGAYRAEGYVVREFPGYRYVAEVKEHLQNLGHHKRQAEQKYVLPQRACCHLYRTRLCIHFISLSLSLNYCFPARRRHRCLYPPGYHITLGGNCQARTVPEHEKTGAA